MALNYDRRVTSLSHIAREQGISLKYLEQLIRPLKRAGIVAGLRGAAGGYRLSRPPSRITVGEIIRALEEPMNPVECLDDSGLCERSDQCTARNIWIHLSQSIQRTLDGITLEEILHHQQGRTAHARDPQGGDRPQLKGGTAT